MWAFLLCNLQLRTICLLLLPLPNFLHFTNPLSFLHLFRSANGSPIEQCEEGALVATVSKRRRPNGIGGIPGEAMFDINVGGEVISLSDPNSMTNLSNQMKSTVTAQLNVLQDQISKLMSQIES